MKLVNAKQKLLFPVHELQPPVRHHTSSTFTDNITLPVHRWFRFSAGFSAPWVESVIADAMKQGTTRVFDPFCGSATTLIAAENVGAQSCGIEAHPFLCRIARAKLARRTNPQAYKDFAQKVRQSSKRRKPHIHGYAPLIQKCYDTETLSQLDCLRQAVEHYVDGSPPSELTWLTLVGILRKVSHVGTAPWQYVLPKKSKKRPLAPLAAFDELSTAIYNDMLLSQKLKTPRPKFLQADARAPDPVPKDFATLIVTSPPYPNNYDYADATRLEMTFLGQIRGWGDLQASVRKYLIRSCSQHVPERAVDLQVVLSSPELAPLQPEISKVCQQLAEIRLTRGGKKTYHLMVACYFLDLAKVWHALRTICTSPSRACFVVGDSAPYGVYVPVIDWLGKLAISARFKSFRFERTRDRNVKWKNRKHRVPLCEGRLWVDG